MICNINISSTIKIIFQAFFSFFINMSNVLLRNVLIFRSVPSLFSLIFINFYTVDVLFFYASVELST